VILYYLRVLFLLAFVCVKLSCAFLPSTVRKLQDDTFGFDVAISTLTLWDHSCIAESGIYNTIDCVSGGRFFLVAFESQISNNGFREL
jgi:hypothetical protein